MFDFETRTLVANEHIERLQASALAPASPLRLTLADWLIRAGNRLLPECPERERSILAHKALASPRS
jgi:hypothetical protein